jgi:Bacterial pre-peptidase C-terminal domain
MEHEVVGAITGFNARWYRFRVSEPGEIILSLIGDGSQINLDLYLYHSVDVHFRRDPAWSSRGAFNTETIAADLTEGTYYIHVPIAEKSAATTTFTLRGKWKADPPLQVSGVPRVTSRETDTIPKPVEVIPPAVDPGKSSAIEIASGTSRRTELTITRRIAWFKVIVHELSDVKIVITAEIDAGDVVVSALDQTLSVTGKQEIQRTEMQPGTYYIRLMTSLPRAHARVTVRASVLDTEGFLESD